MSTLAFSVIESNEDIPIWGLCQKSNDKTQAKDIPTISKKYYEAVSKESGEVIPLFVVSKDYYESTKDFQLLPSYLLYTPLLMLHWADWLLLRRLLSNSLVILKQIRV